MNNPPTWIPKWTHEDTFEPPLDMHHENGKIGNGAYELLRKASHVHYMCGRLSSAMELPIGTWVKPLPRMTPHIFLQTEIYNMGVSIAKHIPSIKHVPLKVAPTMVCHAPPWT